MSSFSLNDAIAALSVCPGYPVLVLGTADSGKSELIRLIRQHGPAVQVKLYEEPPEEPVVFKAVWVVADMSYSLEQIHEMAKLIRGVKESPAKYGVTDETLWVSVATDHSIVTALADATAAHEKACRIAADEKLADKLFDRLKRELTWVSDGNLLTKQVSFGINERDGESRYRDCNELLDMNLSEEHLDMLCEIDVSRGDGPCENVHEVPAYPVLVIGDADSGAEHLVEFIYDENNGYGPSCVIDTTDYNKEPTELQSKPFKSVWVFVEIHYSDAQTQKTIDYIRSVKDSPDKYPVTDETKWILVATDAATAVPLEKAIDAAEDPDTYESEELSKKILDRLDSELEWVSENNRYRQTIFLHEGEMIAQLIDIVLPVPHLYKTDFFQLPERYNKALVAKSCAQALIDVSQRQLKGFSIVLRKSDTYTDVEENCT